MNTIIEKIRAEKIIRLIISILEDKHPNTFWRSNEMESGVYTEELVSFLSDLEKKCEDFPTTDEEMAKFLDTHPKVELPEKYKTPDWMFEKSEKPSEGLEIDIEKFIEKMDAWKARFSRPDDIPIKATMAFTARMFYMYPKVARKWYESLPKAIQD